MSDSCAEPLAGISSRPGVARYLGSVFTLIFSLLLPMTAAAAALHIEVLKSKRELRLFEGERLIKTFRVALGSNPVPPKVREGDRATPEGKYFICVKNPKSKFHLSLGVSYPNEADAERGFKSGLISAAERAAIVKAQREGKTPLWNTKLGGEIFVHGNGSRSGWTWGCIALDNADMDELYRLVPVGTTITIKP